uniref:galactokinase n=1 Tax=Nocardia uniformis TaxID=53432 RepID=UPI00082BC2C0
MAGQWLAPGRVNLIGEHTDYNDGFVLPIALPQGVTCTAASGANGEVRVASRQRPGAVVTWPIPEIDDSESGDAVGRVRHWPDWARYPLGVAAEYLRRGHPITGVDLELDGTVPMGAGLSSSAALSCSVAVALRDLFAPGLTDAELIDIARTAENEYAGVPTGILDQSASILCRAGHALFLDVRTREHRQIPFDLERFGLRLLVIDTRSPHRLVDGEYARRRAQCEAAAATLGVASLRDIATIGDTRRIGEPVLRRRARHVVSENLRVRQVADILGAGRDPREVGPILTAGHASLRDDFEVSTDRLNTAVEAALTAGAYGARMVGGGFGGSVIALVDARRAACVTGVVEAAFAESDFAVPHAFPVVASAGAHRVE